MQEARFDAHWKQLHFFLQSLNNDLPDWGSQRKTRLGGLSINIGILQYSWRLLPYFLPKFKLFLRQTNFNVHYIECRYYTNTRGFSAWCIRNPPQRNVYPTNKVRDATFRVVDIFSPQWEIGLFCCNLLKIFKLLRSWMPFMFWCKLFIGTQKVILRAVAHWGV